MKRPFSHPALWSAICLLAGCAGPLKPVFEPVDASLEWPRPPDRARIKYVGQLSGEESLHIPKKGLEVLGEVFTGPKPTTGFSTPTAVAVLVDRVFVADGQSHAVFMLDLGARLFKPIREAAGAPLNWPADVTIADGRLVIADSGRPGIFFFDLDGNYQRSLPASGLKRPCAIAWDSSSRNLWVLDAAEHRIVVFNSSGVQKSQFGARGSGPGEFNFPAGLSMAPDFNAIVADSMNFRVQLIDHEGRPTATFGKKGDAAGDFALPRDTAVDSDGHIYVLDNQFENIQVFDKSGRLLMALGQEGRGPGEFYLPSGITIDSQDRIWIADTYNRRIQVFQYSRETTP
jgi:DNA-binding beta-propeller fold protein YncE